MTCTIIQVSAGQHRFAQVNAGGRERARKAFAPGSIHTKRSLFQKFLKKLSYSIIGLIQIRTVGKQRAQSAFFRIPENFF